MLSLPFPFPPFNISFRFTLILAFTPILHNIRVLYYPTQCTYRCNLRKTLCTLLIQPEHKLATSNRISIARAAASYLGFKRTINLFYKKSLTCDLLEESPSVLIIYVLPSPSGEAMKFEIPFIRCLVREQKRASLIICYSDSATKI